MTGLGLLEDQSLDVPVPMFLETKHKEEGGTEETTTIVTKKRKNQMTITQIQATTHILTIEWCCRFSFFGDSE
jgi:hypothetical protein